MMMRFLDATLPGLAANLALDEALLQEVEDEGLDPVLRVWELPEMAVVLGASGRIAEDVDVAACERDAVAIGRRSSGGGTVVIGPGAINLAVVLPVDFAPEMQGVESAQTYVLERIGRAIRQLGPPVELLGSGDLTIDRRKFCGSAQRRLRRSVLVHTTVCDRLRLDAISLYTHPPRRQPAYREGRSHQDFVTNLGLGRNQVVQAFRNAWLPPDTAPELAVLPETRVQELVASKFADRGWIERL
jgi:lipoate-protein ligase A